jgi:phosphoglycolate phosphatase-like HAD superfamily hydrolase
MIVTSDFDSTLIKPVEENLPFGDGTFWKPDVETPNEKVLDILRELAADGHRIEVVTTRDRTNAEEVFDFINGHSLPIRDVHFTCGDEKLPTLQELGSSMHFDDSLEELERLADSDTKGKLVPHPHDKKNHLEQVRQFKTVS